MTTIVRSKSNSHSELVDIITGASASSTPPVEEVIFEDGILCLILSFLDLREAVRTSVLSRRWRRLWPRLTKFDFNAITVLDALSLRGHDLDGEEAYNLTKGKTAKFIRSVDSVLQQLQGTQLDVLKVRHFFDKSHSHHLDAWLCFAVASKTKMLRMHLFKPYTKWYDFPCHLLGSSPFLELISLINCSFRLPCNFGGLGHLQKLILAEVDVSQEDFEHILSNWSSTLTKLVLWNMRQLVSITSPCPLSQLEILSVENCCQLRKIDIRAINLLQVDYEGIPVDFKFRQSPKLNRAQIFLKTEGSMHNLNVYLTKLSSSLCHLESLTLKISGVSQVADLPKVSSRFAYLTHLDWDWTSGFKMSLFHLDTLLDVAPSLKELNLCDGILCLILSFLDLREAVRTSVLSRRWRCLWPRLTKFDFNSITVLDAQSLRGRHLDGDEAYKLTKGKTVKFIRSVDSVLQQLQGTQLDEFRVGHFFDKSHSHHLDAWLCFAAASKAKMLRMHLFKPYTKWYDFPCHLLGSSPFLQLISLINCSFRLPCNFGGLSHLQKLILVEVDVTQEDFEHILSNCSSTLTKLVLWNVQQLVSITSSCPLSQLEVLLVENCYQLRKIDIRAINLLRVEYEGIPVDFKFRQSPKLNRAQIFLKTEGSMHNLNIYLTKLSSSFCHLESLTLKISGVSQVGELPKVSSRFAYLTHLDWDWTPGFKMSLIHLDTLLDVAPSLGELNLCLSERVLEQPPKAPSKFREMLHKHTHCHLKTVRLRNFYFDTWQIEIAAYLLNKAIELKSMTIEKGCKPSWFASKEVFDRGKEILTQQVPENVRLIIL